MKVLLDNATISSAMRALGKAPIKNKSILDLEQVALERLCEAVLLADEVIIPDTYKESFSETRKDVLSESFFRHQKIAKETDEDFQKMSQGISDVWSVVFKNGSEEEVLPQYFQQVNAYVKFVWEYSSSEFYLVFRALGIEKRNPLIEAVLSSDIDYKEDINSVVLDINQDKLDWEYLSKPVKKMVAMMSWLGERYLWHQMLSSYLNVTYSPHPLRDFFAVDFIDRLRSVSTGGTFMNVVLGGIEIFKDKYSDKLQILGKSKENYNVSIPNFLPILALDSNNGDDFLHNLFCLRETQELKELRMLLNDVELDTQLGNFEKLSRLNAEISTIGRNIILQKGIDLKYLSVNSILNVIGISLPNEDFGPKIQIPSVLYQQYFINKRYRCFIRQTLLELAQPSKLGNVKDKLDSYAFIEDNGYLAQEPYYLKEDPKYSKYHKPFTTNVRPKFKG